jgi:hypothetical protein
MKIGRTGAAMAFLVMFTSPGHADRIDGNWCSPKGQTITVDGQMVTSPGGKPVIANYDRHHVDFDIPEGEANAGHRFSANQLNDDEISVSIRSPSGQINGKPEIWRQCKPIS